MPIEVSWRNLDKEKEFVVSRVPRMPDTPVQYHLSLDDHLPLVEHSFGLLGPTAPVDGFSGSIVHEAIVAHCDATSRSFVFLSGTNGAAPSRNHLEACSDGLKYMADGKTGVSIHFAFIRRTGQREKLDTSAANGFARALRKSLETQAPTLRLKMGPFINTSEHYFTVQKATGAITLLTCPPDRPSFQLYRFDGFFINAGILLSLETRVQWAIHRNEHLYWRQYEGDHETKTLPVISSVTRSLLLSRRASGTRAHLSGGARGGPSNEADFLEDLFNRHFALVRRDKLKDHSSWATVNLLIDNYLGGPPACIICAEEEHVFKCGGCECEYYCSLEHQKQDWPFHREWCKKNRKSTSH